MNRPARDVKRQIAMVLDLNKCLGCHTCTVACKKLWTNEPGLEYVYWNNVETRPGRGYPAAWETTGGRTERGEVRRGTIPNLDDGYGHAWRFDHQRALFPVEGLRRLAPEPEPRWGPNWDEDQGTGHYPDTNYYFYLPRLCNHCTHPACLEACPRRAIVKRRRDGIVVVDQDRCHGYRFCVEACPYKKVYFDVARGVAAKCIFCFPRVEAGTPPACARQCPGRLRFVGYLDDPDGPIWKLVHHYKVALPLHPEFGTGPNVFYVPPLSPDRFEDGRPTGVPRIPPEYLESLFGPEVHAALERLRREREKRRRGEPSPLMDLLIAYRWKENFRLGKPHGGTP